MVIIDIKLGKTTMDPFNMRRKVLHAVYNVSTSAATLEISDSGSILF